MALGLQSGFIRALAYGLELNMGLELAWWW